MISEQEPQGPAQDGSQTAFRRAEKTFQLHREEVYKTRGRRRVSKGFVVRPTDLSDVLDLQLGAPLPEGVSCIGVPSGMPSNAAAFAFAAHPGLLLVRCAVPPKLQRELVVEAFTRFCEPPNHTNHIRAYPEGLPGIWHAAQQGLRLQQQQQPQQTQQTGEAAGEAARSTAGRDAGSSHSSGFASSGSDSGSNCSNASGSSASPGVAAGLWGPEGSGPLAESLLQKLRWATLGPPYDWTQRRYLQGVPHMPLPAQLHQLAVALAGLAATLPAGTSSGADDAGAVRSTAAAAAAIGSGQAPAFCPDAALVNYYVEGDTLNGHIDDAEPSLDKPLVSLSLGCDAIFLIGSTTKEVPPTPLLLHSGDAVVMAGQARRCYHGVPRVLAGEGRPLAVALQAGGKLKATSVSSGSGEGRDGCEGEEAWEDAFAPFARHLQRCRINISIRDTR